MKRRRFRHSLVEGASPDEPPVLTKCGFRIEIPWWCPSGGVSYDEAQNSRRLKRSLVLNEDTEGFLRSPYSR